MTSIWSSSACLWSEVIMCSFRFKIDAIFLVNPEVRDRITIIAQRDKLSIQYGYYLRDTSYIILTCTFSVVQDTVTGCVRTCLSNLSFSYCRNIVTRRKVSLMKRQTDRQTYRQIHRQKQADRPIDRRADLQIDRNSLKDPQTDRQKTDLQIDRQTE